MLQDLCDRSALLPCSLLQSDSSLLSKHKPSSLQSGTVLYYPSTNLLVNSAAVRQFFAVWAQTFMSTLLQSDSSLLSEHKPSCQHCCSQTVLCCLSTNLHVNTAAVRQFFAVWVQTYMSTLLQSDSSLLSKHKLHINTTNCAVHSKDSFLPFSKAVCSAKFLLWTPRANVFLTEC